MPVQLVMGQESEFTMTGTALGVAGYFGRYTYPMAYFAWDLTYASTCINILACIHKAKVLLCFDLFLRSFVTRQSWSASSPLRLCFLGNRILAVHSGSAVIRTLF
ncbi:hypothetical protein PZA11_004880 [Diplocarpon coronariae]